MTIVAPKGLQDTMRELVAAVHAHYCGPSVSPAACLREKGGAWSETAPVCDALTRATNAEIVACMVFEKNAPKRERARRLRRF